MKALLLIDIQNDFLPGGALAVSDGDQVIPLANQMMADYRLVIATQDWHPSDHGSFASQHDGKEIGDMIRLDGLDQVLWPDHCVQGTPGAGFASDLDVSRIDQVMRKGTDRDIDSYSGFFDNARRKATELDDYLRRNDVDEVHLIGLATDYCVKFTALDAIDLGFRTCVYRDGVRGVDLHPRDCEQALAEMQTAGVSIV